MERDILSIGLSDNVNEMFQRFLILDKMNLISRNSMAEAFSIISREPFCLIIINASELSVNETQEIVGRIRRTTYTPLLILSTAEAAAPTLEVGADVCIPPSADIHALFSQAMALVRRNELYCHYDVGAQNVIAVYRGDLVIDSLRHCVTQSGKEIPLLPREFRLLAYMARNPGIVLTPEQLGHAIWLDDTHSAQDVAKVISKLRHALNDRAESPRYVETIRNVGYRLLPK